MSDFTKATLRIFLGICLWWLCFSPFLAHDLASAFVPISLVTLAIWPLTAFPMRRLTSILHTAIFLAGILAMLFMSHGRWMLPAAATGIAIALFAAISACMHTHPAYPGKAGALPCSLAKLPVLRLAVFHAVWLAGIPIALFLPQNHTAHILTAWTCILLTSAAVHIWPFAVSPEWLGFKTRRECFVSPGRWRLRHIANIILLIIALSASCLLFFW